MPHLGSVARELCIVRSMHTDAIKPGERVLIHGGAGAVGIPFDNGGSAYVHRWGSGVVQDYDSGPLGPSLCMHADAAATAFMVRGGIRDAYLSSGGGEGRLGFPQEDEHGSATGPYQRFAGGYITWDAAAGRFRAY